MLVATLLILFTKFAYSNQVWFSSKINKIYPLADGSIVIMFFDDSSACSNTNNPKYYYLRENQNGVTGTGLKNIYSAVLTAATTKKSVTVNFDDTTAYCYINRLFVEF